MTVSSHSKISLLVKEEVLVVDDDILNQLLIKELLKKIKVEVKTANNGLEAIQYLANRSPRLIFMDIQMPKMDGYQTVNLIREMPDSLSIPIIALTAHVGSEQREKCLAAGMDDFLEKPIDFSNLRKKVIYWLAR